MTMTIKIEENENGHININMKWTSRYASIEEETIKINEYDIGRKEETICKEILKKLKKAKADGRLSFLNLEAFNKGW